MEKVIGVEKASRLLSLYTNATSIEKCIQMLQQQRLSVIEKVYEACALLDVPVNGLTVLVGEGKVEWPDPEKKEEPEKE